jgi:hypothetical protein
MKLIFATIFAFISITLACNDAEYPVGSGELSSPNYPNFYEDGEDCMYFLQANQEIPNAVVNITLDDFKTEGCCDYLYIYDGDSIMAPLIQRYRTLCVYIELY